ncbi:MAG TPA: FecR domain-containing protein [Polyangiaceae bacterium]|jgi:transmembrane sensor|nr:FecR domain-containing protein [Polyangiaceae bacterium]
MSEREQELEHALNAVSPEWSGAHTERGLVRLQRTVQRRRAAALGAGAILLAAAAAALTWSRVRAHEPSPQVALSVLPSQERIVRFSDGSTVHLLDATTDVSIVEARPERIVSALDHGAATFEVSHVDGRVFRVQAGQVIVEALGTVFTVERGDSTVRVSVGRGRVRVDFGTGSRELAVGQSGTFPPSEEPTPSASVASVESITPPSPVVPSASAKPAPSWKELARAGKPVDAYRALESAPATDLNNAEALLLAADIARLAGHPQEAVPYLERVLRDFKADPRASLAAFSLGRVLMNSLGRPAEAAGYFERARALSHEPSLAEDALAREVEAWARAGQADRARRRAEDYVRLYPTGQRLNAVKTFGGIE